MTRCQSSAAILLAAVLAAACGGGDNGASKAADDDSITPATPPSDVCGMLTLSDVQGLFPGAATSEEQPTPDTSDLGFWSRDCKWDGTPTSVSVELVVFGATTKDGLAGIKLAARSGDVNMPVSGLGDEAHYWQDTTDGTNGLWALDGSYSVDVTAYFFMPFPTEDQFHPLVQKALGEIQ